MHQLSPATADPVRVGIVGTGRIGTSHATLLRTQVPGARLVAVADAFPDSARALGDRLGVRAAGSPEALFGDAEVEAVVVAASSTAHADLVTAAAAAGKAVFCEKPAGMTLEEVDRGIEACRAAGVPFQVGFNRRFAPEFAHARRLVDEGVLGTPQLLRSLTRDPGLADPGAVPPWTIFTQTLIHDFDTLLWLNPGARPVTVHATADALVAPDFKDAGLLDTAVVVVTFDNGALATAEASFSAAYGYDVRGEVFGSRGMVTMGDGATSSLRLHDASGRHATTARGDVELLSHAYAGELTAFVEAVRAGTPVVVGGEDARRALRVALACIESMRTGTTVRLGEEG
ncbi:Gfo/Idh/MocA family oxidoreductase [Nocardioides marmoribigeumensis]|jgi:myo-inositol 2-dehydrogenase/D-chiro-inositol 1-dehydrogenase|uniref:Myo-inositol 2-dehydrogenase/D-chiro-inositol 1-dehydrogenase n=1 Tax=Nocardioides marmoribigeumensis TaxID=433649 RepID=A0ABU2BT79_9ACTN|nr:Gfo/Idh/MocA family oxidoreductase [Nocardioides marmoribigeumensis]MDR7361838.1 myo-inositol 2-dehydrogenase/D-chiro-inositol 1-dehydrogenase [Nocardioides marmoribigeumensis]